MTFWTDERVTNRATLAMVAVALGTTRNAVLGKANRLGITQRPHTSGWPHASREVSMTPKPSVPRKRHNDGEAPPARPLPEPIAGGVATIDLTPRMCRFPLSTDAPWRHCGGDAEPLSAWCGAHRGVVYQKVRA